MWSHFVPPKEIHTNIITKLCILSSFSIFRLVVFEGSLLLQQTFTLWQASEDVCLTPVRCIYPSHVAIPNPQ